LQEAEASGTIDASIGQTQEVRPEFKSTVVPLPRTIYDANQFPYDVQPNGSIAHGRWAYYGAFNAGASVLEVNGCPSRAPPRPSWRRARASSPSRSSSPAWTSRKVYVPQAATSRATLRSSTTVRPRPSRSTPASRTAITTATS
jgi:hypothetical protein